MSKVVAITGGYGNLGVAVGRRFVAGGWSVALVNRGADADAGVAREFATQLLQGGVDVADLGAARKAVDAIVARYGRLDALVNAAGAFRWQTLADGDLETWDAMYRTNVRTAATMSKAALEALASRDGDASIVNIAASAATKASAGMGAYAASKAGVIRLTEALADELKDRGVTVNAILPTIIDTPQNRKDMPKADFGRWVKPESIADVIFYLASDAARDITGAAIVVAGRV
jgi:NAD(P)-dependent dehydrogenase (short-subunit alcohol dehydrogenase family)